MEESYTSAISYIKQNKYDQAIGILKNLEYKDSKAVLNTAIKEKKIFIEQEYLYALESIKNGKYNKAFSCLFPLASYNYKDSKNKLIFVQGKIALIEKERQRELRKERLRKLAGGTNAGYLKLLKIIKAHPDWDDEICSHILNEIVKTGMTREQVLASWGKPSYTTDDFGECWVYGEWVLGIGHTYLRFKDGILSSICD